MAYRDVVEILHGRHKKNKRRSAFRAFLIASGTAFSAGVLLAPRSGYETRLRIVNGVARTGLAVKRGTVRTVNQLKVVAESVAGNTKIAATEVRSAAGEVQAGIKEVKALKLVLERQSKRISGPAGDFQAARSDLNAASERLKEASGALKDKIQ